MYWAKSTHLTSSVELPETTVVRNFSVSNRSISINRCIMCLTKMTIFLCLVPNIRNYAEHARCSDSHLIPYCQRYGKNYAGKHHHHVIVEHGRMRDVLRSLVESIALICMEINANVKKIRYTGVRTEPWWCRVTGSAVSVRGWRQEQWPHYLPMELGKIVWFPYPTKKNRYGICDVYKNHSYPIVSILCN